MGFKLFHHKFKRINAEKALEKAQQIQADYHENLQGISEEVHPFSLNDNSINDAKKIEERLENRAQIFERIAQSGYHFNAGHSEICRAWLSRPMSNST